MSSSKILTGNAITEGTDSKGWFLGHFKEAGLTQSEDLEVKWSTHPKGESHIVTREPDERITTLAILIKGKSRITFEGHEALTLEHEADYVIYTHNLSHESLMLEDTTFITVRWPSFATK